MNAKFPKGLTFCLAMTLAMTHAAFAQTDPCKDETQKAENFYEMCAKLDTQSSGYMECVKAFMEQKASASEACKDIPSVPATEPDSAVSAATMSVEAEESAPIDHAAMGKEAAKDAAMQAEKNESSGSLGWRGWTRIATFTAAAVFGTLAVYKDSEMNDKKDELRIIASEAIDEEQYDKAKKQFYDAEKQRNAFMGIAGACAFVGILTFAF
jgi:hypothetical protein